MKLTTRSIQSSFAALLAAGAISSANAASFTVDPGASWLGYMNVFDLGNVYQWGQPWGTPDLCATFSGPTLTLTPNTINPPNGLADGYWYQPNGSGNKIMDANFYQEFTGTLAGQSVTFSGNVLANSLTSAHTAVAFIKDFAPDYSSSIASIVPLTPGEFSLTLNTINDPNRHVQFGFTVNGVNVWAANVGPYGKVDVTAVPEPATAGILMSGLTLAVGLRRRFAGRQ